MRKVLLVLQFAVLFLSVHAQDIQFKTNVGHTQKVVTVVFYPDGSRIASASADHSIIIWDVLSGKVIMQLKGHTDSVNDIDISDDGKYLVSGSYDQTIKLWDAKTGIEIRTFLGHKNNIHNTRFSSDGKTIISTSEIGTRDQPYFKRWDLETGKELPCYIGRKGAQDICFTPDGSLLVSSHNNANIYVWNPISGVTTATLLGHEWSVLSVACSPDGNFIASGSQDNTIRIWDLKTGKELNKLIGHRDWIFCVDYSLDGKFLISSSRDSTIKLWDVSSGKVLKTFNYEGQTNQVKFSPDCHSFIGATGNTIDLRDVASGKELMKFSDQIGSVYSVCSTTDGKYIANGMQNTIKLWDVAQGKLVKTFIGHSSTITSIAFSTDNNQIVSGSNDKTVKLWDANSGKLIRTYTHKFDNSNIASNGQIKTVAISPNGKYIAGGSFNEKNENLMIWDTKTGMLLKSIRGDDWMINSIAFSLDGKHLVIGGHMDHAIKIYDVVTGALVNSFPSEKRSINSISYSPDGKNILIATGVDDLKNSQGDIKIRNAYTGAEVIAFTNEGQVVNSCSYSHDGKYIVSGSSDNTIKIWDAVTAVKLKQLEGISARINKVIFSSNDKKIVSSCDDGTIKITDLESDNWITFVSSINESKWIVYTSDFYWDGSQDCGDLVTMVKGPNVWNIDQFALKNNRPDIILERLGNDDKDVITHFNKQYEKRLKRLGVKKEDLSTDYSVPKATIIETNQADKKVSLKLQFSDEKVDLKRFNVFVNDVPLFGSYGKDISGRKVEVLENIALTKGNNKIEVSCVNKKGVESYRALAYANNNSMSKGDLYLLTFGISKYQNSIYNLAYAEKDALDLEKVVQGLKGKGYANIYTKVLTNEQVTPNAIKASKDFVKNAKPDDTFVLFIAGHGMHDNDKEETYYYLTYNADLNNLKNTSCNFETIEDLLQGIPPRNKLFLMDACESGEIDDEDQGQMITAATGAGISSRGFKSTTKPITDNGKQTTTKRSYLYQKDRYIYNDLVRRSGAIVFSSSKGGELSYERSDIENGLFTEYIMKALTTAEADKDGNGTVSTDELREYVSAQVAKASGDLQHPTVDRDNIYQKFGFQVK